MYPLLASCEVFYQKKIHTLPCSIDNWIELSFVKIQYKRKLVHHCDPRIFWFLYTHVQYTSEVMIHEWYTKSSSIHEWYMKSSCIHEWYMMIKWYTSKVMLLQFRHHIVRIYYTGILFVYKISTSSCKDIL